MRILSGIAPLLLAAAALAQNTPEHADIRSIDFKNFSFRWDDSMHDPPHYNSSPWHWRASLPESKIRVVKGKYHFYDPSQAGIERERAPTVTVGEVTYGVLEGQPLEHAAVHLNYGTGGTQNWDYLYVYGLLRGHPQLMGILKSGSRGDGGLYRVAFRDGLLVLDFADPDRKVGDCCSEGYVRVRYRWRRNAFVESGQSERGDIHPN